MRRAAKTDATVSHGKCPVCFVPLFKDLRGRKRKFCSRECVGKSVGLNGAARFKGALCNYTCLYCKKEFSVYHKARKFCSQTCTGLQRSLDEAKKMSRYVSRVDQNQPEIVEALKAYGASVLDCTNVRRGFPDLIVGFMGKNLLMEVKNPKNGYGKKGLSKTQIRWAEKWPSPVYVVYTPEDALKVLKEVEQAIEAVTN